MRKHLTLIALALACALFGCGQQTDMSADTHGFSAPTQQTADLNAAVAKELPLSRQPFKTSSHMHTGLTVDLLLMKSRPFGPILG